MPSVLIVDDDDALRKIYARYLTAEGFKLFEASNGEQALLKFGNETIDVILLDVRMPVANGQILIDSLQHFHPEAKIIVFSCYDQAVQKKMIKTADDYFDKSEGCQSLLLKIKTILPKIHGLKDTANTKQKKVASR